MDNGVKATIDARKMAFSNAYELSNEFDKEIDELFNKIYKFGESCSDAMDFENKFSSSPLNEEYMNLFVKIGTKCPAKKYDSGEIDTESNGKKIFDEASSDAKFVMDEITRPARRQARMEMDSKLRDTPLGKIEQASNMFHLFKRFKKPKKTDIENEE